ncbi:MAG: site-specific integrase, partial [Candidatus Dormibacteraceae bacterium]
ELMGRNQTDAVSVQRPGRTEMQTLSGEELRVLFATSAEDRFHALWVLLGTTGMRIGEALGLRWSDIDLETGRLEVRRALQFQQNNGLVFVEPKSSRSRRTLHLAAGTVEKLHRHQIIQSREREFAGPEWQEQGLVFPNLKGRPLGHSTVSASFAGALKTAGAKRIRIHDLRHTAATLLLKSGVHPKVVQEFLGHSSISLTLDTYSHVVPSLHEEIAIHMQAVLEPKSLIGSKLAAKKHEILPLPDGEKS